MLCKRSDNFHEISSIFYPVKSLFDILEIVNSDKFSFSTSGIPIKTNNNICEIAYDILQQEFKLSPVKIHLHKQINIGSGLGGGSSDGAFTLKLLNKIFKLNLSVKQLESYALQLGADCPFFIQNKPKYVTGLGEFLSPINLDLSSYNIRIVNSNLHISTVKAYQAILPSYPEKKLIESIRRPIKFWKEDVKNDFEDSIFLKYPELRDIKERLYDEGALYVSMSGSGSSIYAIFKK